ncbi:MAG: M23 family metallopeptidase [Bacteroidales bacterium]|nr:M23 family metallopeptidase [Bacteroidales bacterium]
MTNKKYIFNPQTLEYEEYKTSRKRKFWSVVLYLLSTSVTAFLIVVLIQNFFGSPTERMQAREIEYLKLQYDIMNDKIDDLDLLLGELEDRDDNIYRMIFEADPIPSSVRRAGYGGSNRYMVLDGYVNSDMVVNTAKRIDVLTSQLYVQSKSFDDIYEMAKNKSEMLSCIPAIMPVKGTDIYRISSHYGHRTDPFYKVTKFHSGIDFSGPVGLGIYATGDGVVAKVEKNKSGYGNNIIVDHGYGYKTRYAHLSSIKVKKGEKVKRGQEIGTLGNTGKSTAPHLHYEVIKNNKAVNPINFFYNDLTPEEYDKILELSQHPSQTMD